MKKTVLLALVLLCLSACAAAETAVPVTSVDATSWITGSDPTAYMPQRMIDGDERTSYQFSTRTTPLGQAYITFYFSAPSGVTELWIKNGFWKITNGYDQYTRNSRVKTMSVDFRYSGSYSFTDAQTVTLPDDARRADWHRISLGSRQNVTAVRFRIREIYRGTKYPNDVCISEVRFISGSSGGSSPSSGGALYGLALQKLATRDGPGTTFRETGTYNVAGQYIRILSRAWDSRNSIWWVKCEIPYRNEIRVLWTGYKRFDSSTLPLDRIPIEGSSGSVDPVTPRPRQETAGDWRSAYRRFISTGEYMGYMNHPDAAYRQMLMDRDTVWDSFALYDLNHDGTPELLVLASYGPEQADVFTFVNGSVLRLGMMGGDNFFQEFFYFDDAVYPGLFTASGGPAMRIDTYTLSGSALTRRTLGQTIVNDEGDDTVGLQLSGSDSRLYQLLYSTLIYPGFTAHTLTWRLSGQLQTEANWTAFWQTAVTAQDAFK